MPSRRKVMRPTLMTMEIENFAHFTVERRVDPMEEKLARGYGQWQKGAQGKNPPEWHLKCLKGVTRLLIGDSQMKVEQRFIRTF